MNKQIQNQVNAMSDDTKIGLELAFSDTNIEETVAGPLLPSQGNQKFTYDATIGDENDKAVTTCITTWLKHIIDNREKDEHVTIKAIDHQHGEHNTCEYGFDFNSIKDASNTKIGYKVDAEKAKKYKANTKTKKRCGRFRIEYTNQNLTPWHWDITLDNSCIEIQTPPTPLHSYLTQCHIQRRIENHIIGGAKAAGLNSRSGIGGCQVNVDFETGFEKSYNSVAKLIFCAEKYYDDNADNELGENGNSIWAKSALNAALLKDDRVMTQGNSVDDASKMTLKDKLTDVYNNYNVKNEDQQFNWKEFIKEYSKLMREYPTAKQLAVLSYTSPPTGMSQVQTRAWRDEVERFQFVNVTLVDIENQNEQRVEFRCFRALYTLQEVILSLEVVKKMITATK